jgi:L-rhamnose-H+ transport protein
MNILIAFLLILLAGIVNGSFALPTKYINKWSFENIWLEYSLWAFIILPWLVMFFLVPQIFQIYHAVSFHLLTVMLIGGFIFGTGQVCFVLALNLIGFGLGFVINLGLGISLGFLLPLLFQHPEKIFTTFGFTTLAGVFLAIAGLIISSHAGLLRDRFLKKEAIQKIIAHKESYLLGVILAIVAGISSALQNFTFSLTLPMQDLALSFGATKLGAANIIWPGFLTCGFLPYAGYMLFLLCKNSSFVFYRKKNTGHYFLLTILMAVFSYSSLLLYSKASQLIGAYGPLLGWPLFMILIILTSSFWGWRHKEWEGCGPKAEKTMKIGLMFLLLAMIVLGYSSHFNV